MLDVVLDAGQQCVWCNRDTSFGSGLFVNRIPVDCDVESVDWLTPEEAEGYDRVEGYGCEECYEGENV